MNPFRLPFLAVLAAALLYLLGTVPAYLRGRV